MLANKLILCFNSNERKKTEVLQSSPSESNSGENISKLVNVIINVISFTFPGAQLKQVVKKVVAFDSGNYLNM